MTMPLCMRALLPALLCLAGPSLIANGLSQTLLSGEAWMDLRNGLRILALLLGAFEDVLRVFVVPHQEPRVVALQAVVARDDVGRDLLVGRAEVRPAVHVVDGGGEKVFHVVSAVGRARPSAPGRGHP